MTPTILGNPCIAVSRPDKRINAFIQGGPISHFVLPKDIKSIAAHAFDNVQGLTEIRFPRKDIVVDVSPNSGIGADVKFIVDVTMEDEYAAKYPSRTIEVVGQKYTIPYIGDATLTDTYVGQCITAEPEALNAVKVVIPEEFSDYTSDAISAITSAFTNLEEIRIEIEQDVTQSAFQTKLSSASWPKKAVFSKTDLKSAYNGDALTIPSDIEDFTIRTYYNGRNGGAMFKSGTVKSISFIQGIRDGYTYSSILNLNWFDSANRNETLERVCLGTISNVTGPSSLSTIGVTSNWKVVTGTDRTISIYVDSIQANQVRLLSLNQNTDPIDDDSLARIINALYDYSGGDGHTLVIGSQNISKLSSEQTALAAARNWTLQ